MLRIYKLRDYGYTLEIKSHNFDSISDEIIIDFERFKLAFHLIITDQQIRIRLSHTDINIVHITETIEFKTMDNIEIGIDKENQIIVSINNKNLSLIHPICHVSDLIDINDYDASIGLFGLQSDSMRDLLNCDCFNFKIGDMEFDVDIEI